jgi:hypothetical protein
MPVTPVKLSRNRKAFDAARRRWISHPSVLVEGDSWFQYDAFIPANPTSSNLFLGTCEYFTCIALLLSHVGDTMAEMVGPYVDFQRPQPAVEVDAKGDKNLRAIRRYLARQNPFDLFFFSGGGNDIVDNLAKLLCRYQPGMGAADALIAANVSAQMSAIRQGYLGLLAARDAVSPGTWIITHQYGVPNLRKGAFRRLGLNFTSEWIKPQFRERGYLAGAQPTEAELQLMTEIIQRLMHDFSAVLAELQQAPSTRRFFVAPTAGVIQSDHWRDEMHLTKAGFRLAAAEIKPKLHELFPSWTA